MDGWMDAGHHTSSSDRLYVHAFVSLSHTHVLPYCQVLCRVRPVLPVEVAAEGGKDVTEMPTPEDIVIQKEDRSKARFEFDRVFAPGINQAEVFESVQPIIVSFMDGYNVRERGVYVYIHIFICWSDRRLCT